ncbi:MAG: hypothetical protein MR366_09525 [Succinivibrio sp.]|nr:hypothetical protein [Succinivibrio sp.]
MVKIANLKLNKSTFVSLAVFIALSFTSTNLNATPLANNSVFHSNTLSTNLHQDYELQQNLPNSIKGIKKNAKVGDFVMLKGRFVRKVDTNILEFTDDGKQAVLVNFEDGRDINLIKAQIEYELWGKVIRNDKLTFVDALNISVKL